MNNIINERINKKLDIVMIKSITNSEYEAFINVYGIVSDMSEPGEIELRLLFNDTKIHSFNEDEITIEKVGYFDFESEDVVGWNSIQALQEQPFVTVAENTNSSIIIAGRVSSIKDLRFIQMTEDVLMGYTTIVEDAYNKSHTKHFSGNNSYVYFFKKIGNLKGENIYRYVSDMVIYKDNSRIDWIANLSVTVDNLKIDENEINIGEVDKVEVKSTRVSNLL